MATVNTVESKLQAQTAGANTSDSKGPTKSWDGSVTSSQSEANRTIDPATATTTQPRRAFRPLRFTFGLALTTLGISMILFVAIRVFDVHYFAGRFAMTLVAVTILCGVIMLGGGFGLMMTASAGFDESEFERLLTSGNIASAEMPSVDNRGQNSSPQTPRRAA